jgi:hypothetical protein
LDCTESGGGVSEAGSMNFRLQSTYFVDPLASVVGRRENFSSVALGLRGRTWVLVEACVLAGAWVLEGFDFGRVSITDRTLAKRLKPEVERS